MARMLVVHGWGVVYVRNCILNRLHGDLLYNFLLILTDLIPNVSRLLVLLPRLARKHQLVATVIFLLLSHLYLLMSDQ